MSFESELRDRLTAAANSFDPDDGVLADAEQRAARMLRARRWRGGVAVAAALALVVLVTLQVLPQQQRSEPPVVGPGPTERSAPDEPSPRVDPEPSPTETVASGDGAGRWEPVDDGPLGPRTDAAATWAGDELFVWGGTGDGEQALDPQGAMYDPSTRQWRPIAPAPTGPRDDATAIWTGEQVLVFGGSPPGEPDGDDSLQVMAYEPAADSWQSFDDAPLEPRRFASATWTGEELIVWGGASVGDQAEGSTPVAMFSDGAAFDPDSGGWRPLGDSPLSPRGDHGAVWDGSRLIVLGGGSADAMEGEFSWFEEHHDAAAYDPGTDTWQPLEAPAQIGPLVVAHWTGQEVVYWTGHIDPDSRGNWLAPGGAWDPETGTFQEMATPPFQQRRDQTVTAWAGELDAMITWGGMIGEGGNRHFADGATYRPDTDAWETLPEADLGARNGHIGAWTGTQLLIWGGATDGSSGGSPPTDYRPRGDGATWQPD